MTHIAPAIYGLWAIMSVLVSSLFCGRFQGLGDQAFDLTSFGPFRVALRLLCVPPVALRQVQMPEVRSFVTQFRSSLALRSRTGFGCSYDTDRQVGQPEIRGFQTIHDGTFPIDSPRRSTQV